MKILECIRWMLSMLSISWESEQTHLYSLIKRSIIQGWLSPPSTVWITCTLLGHEGESAWIPLFHAFCDRTRGRRSIRSCSLPLPVCFVVSRIEISWGSPQTHRVNVCTLRLYGWWWRSLAIFNGPWNTSSDWSESTSGAKGTNRPRWRLPSGTERSL